MSALLNEAEIQALPAEIRQHYREHQHLRSLDDLVYFPKAKRDSFERLTERGSARTIERIRQQEGDAAADEAVRRVAAARADRDQRFARIAGTS